MPSVSPITKSPVAKYLVASKATCKKEGNVCYFFNSQGFYIGKQMKDNLNGVKFFTTVIFGEGFRPLATKSVVLATVRQYFKDDNFKAGIAPVVVSMAKKVFEIDYVNNKYNMVNSEKLLANRIFMVAKDVFQNVGLYQTERPYRYSTEITKVEQNETFDDKDKFKFTIN